MTLVELLVVISILLLFVAVAVPAMRPAMERRQIREAARAVHVYLGQARNRAMRTGRPVGVLFERFELQPQVCTVMRQVEVPPPYSGDEIGSVVRARRVWPHPAFPRDYVVKLQVRRFQLSPGLVRFGDQIQLNRGGPFYRIQDDPSDAIAPDFPVRPDGYIDFSVGTDTSNPPDGWVDSHVLTITVPMSAVAGLPWPQTTWSYPVGFTIYRQPATLWGGISSVARPLRLSRGVVVDLAWSGPDSFLPFGLEPRPEDVNGNGSLDPGEDLNGNGQLDYDTRPVVLMFAPDGTARSIYAWQPPNVAVGYREHPLVEPVYLLVGQQERTPPSPRGFQSGGLQPFDPPDAEDGLYNFQDPGNLWVTVFPQTGLVSVAEVNAGAGLLDLDGNGSPDAANLAHARQLARRSQIAKGER